MTIVRIVLELFVHRAKYLVRLREEIALLQLAAEGAPQVAIDLDDFQIVLLDRLPNFGREAVNKFGAKFDGMINARIVASKNATTNAVTSLKNFNAKASTGQLKGSRKSGNSGAYDKYVWRHCVSWMRKADLSLLKAVQNDNVN
jgi:hypothetical protein